MWSLRPHPRFSWYEWKFELLLTVHHIKYVDVWLRLHVFSWDYSSFLKLYPPLLMKSETVHGTLFSSLIVSNKPNEALQRMGLYCVRWPYVIILLFLQGNLDFRQPGFGFSLQVGLRGLHDFLKFTIIIMPFGLNAFITSSSVLSGWTQCQISTWHS